MENKATPGPWLVVGPSRDIEAKPYGLIAATRYLGNAPEKEAEHAANARLIAAAPETAEERDRLKEINKDLLALLQEGVEGMVPGTGQRADWAERARAVLKKVMGE